MAWLSFFRDRKKLLSIISLALLITANWGVYIWAVNEGRTVEASIGYFINPLVTVVLGLIFFREKMRVLQWVAFALATLGVVLITVFSGTFPAVALVLAFSFGFYGLVKKTFLAGALEGLAAESLAALPIALALFFIPPAGTSYLARLPVLIYALLVLAGPVTALPLFLFAKGAQVLPLSTIGFIQFITPVMQFAFGTFVFQEDVPARNFAAFAFIWAGALLYLFPARSKKTSR
jgi:chloramphenicol-sensitive protein RarD